MLSLQQCIRLACLLEVTARKPGNVHPGASFDDLCYRDFVVSADVIAPVLAIARERRVGPAVLEAVIRTADTVGRNTNLGIVLLLAPLAAADPDVPLQEGIDQVLDGLTREDASLVYRAIRTAGAGGMGEVPAEDVSREPTGTLLEVMRLAARRDSVAAEYAKGFDLVLHTGVPFLAAHPNFADRWEEVVIGLHLELMARRPDTLIARKCGKKEAEHSAVWARDVLDAGGSATPGGRKKLAQFDGWLRERGKLRNPGTTADLVAACLFAALREGHLAPPRL